MDVKQLVEKLTLREKASLCAGADFWHTKGIERLEIPSIMMSDGPHGLRKQNEGGDHLGKNASVEAVCFPSACATACSFDRNLLHDMGKTLGNECRAEGVSILLGPAVNIKRSPLCGRNFEYLSEDPYLAGELAAAYINGVQSEKVGTSVKHFAANNQETERMYGSSEVDERTLREIYLKPFETTVKKASPGTIMCSYNKINGVYASENKWLLDKILREEWNFEGSVISDWGAVNDRLKGLQAGMDLEMPGNHAKNDQKIIDAVHSGVLDEEILDRTVERILKMIFTYRNNEVVPKVFDREADHRKAVEIAKECMVLLKNEEQKGSGVLPLKKDEKVLFVGGFCKNPRYQGGGSSHINPHRVTNAYERKDQYGDIIYKEGFSATQDIEDAYLMEEALSAADHVEKIVVFAGLPDSFESEGYDRTHMRLPECQNKLIEQLCQTGKPVIVVLHNGSPVEMPWNAQVHGIIEAYLGGEGVGEAVMDILYGKANPCGKLAETFPLRLEDTPAYLNYPGARKKVNYAEGIFVGYRYYDSRKMDVLYPFGHGLSYTTFQFDNLRVEDKIVTEDKQIKVQLDVMNTGNQKGKVIVQLYVKDHTAFEIRPEKELKGFQAVWLEPGETKTVEMTLDYMSFACYSTDMAKWYAEDGEYEICIGDSSKNLMLKEDMIVRNCQRMKMDIDENTPIGELLKQEATKIYAEKHLMPFVKEFLGARSSTELGDLHLIMVQHMPVRALRSFSSMSNEDLEAIIKGLREL